MNDFESISFHLEKKNIDWLKEKTDAQLRKSVSNCLNAILTHVRELDEKGEIKWR